MGTALQSQSSPEPFPEYVPWTLRLGRSAVWAALRVMPDGIELRHFMDGELLWSQWLSGDDREELRRALNSAQEAWLGRGWKLEFIA